MSLAPGFRLGRFEVRSLLGRGGMGEVYQAHDTRLGRDVAIKVIAPTLLTDASVISRLEREARAVSALAHPAIVTVFDIGLDEGQSYLVMELLAGTTLRQRLRAGALPVREALDIGIQVAGGLGAAHQAGIVHRDIKPENIFITKAGARILDFGIASLRPSSASLAMAETAAATSASTIVGTAGYMAPEQIRGTDVDGRVDIFALGCVLFELLTGHSPFERTTPMDTIAAALNEPVPDLPATVRPALRQIVARCLAKDRDDRFHSARDLAFALAAIREEAGGPVSGPSSLAPARSVWTIAWAAVAILAIGVASWLLFSRPTVASPSAFEAQVIVPPSSKPIAPAISPDGTWVAYISVADADPRLLVQFLNGAPAVDVTKGQPIPLLTRTTVGTIDVKPDGSAIGLVGPPRATGLWNTPGAFLIPAPLGGPPQRIADLASIRWSPDGTHVAGVQANPLVGDGIGVADADGSNLHTVVPAGGGVHLHHVAWSPDGHSLYFMRSVDPTSSFSQIYRAPASGGPMELVVDSAGVAMYPAPAPDGKSVIYAGERNGEGLNIWRHPLDGSPDTRITTGSGEYTEPSISRDGRLIACLARRRSGELLQIPIDGVIDNAKDLVSLGSLGSSDGEPSTSPGSARIFVTSTRDGRRRVWSLDAKGGDARPLTYGDALDQRPVVSPDGSRVAILSNRGGHRGIWIVAAEGGAPRLLVSGEVLDRVSWSPDGRRLVYALSTDDSSTVWVIDANGGTPQKIPGVQGRVPVWASQGDVIATATTIDGRLGVRFLTLSGQDARASLPIDQVSLPTAMAWSPDGTRLAMVTLPGRAAAEVWLLTIANGDLRRLHQFAPPAELDGVAWAASQKALFVGLRDFTSEVLLLRAR